MDTVSRMEECERELKESNGNTLEDDESNGNDQNGSCVCDDRTCGNTDNKEDNTVSELTVSEYIVGIEQQSIIQSSEAVVTVETTGVKNSSAWDGALEEKTTDSCLEKTNGMDTVNKVIKNVIREEIANAQSWLEGEERLQQPQEDWKPTVADEVITEPSFENHGEEHLVSVVGLRDCVTLSVLKEPPELSEICLIDKEGEIPDNKAQSTDFLPSTKEYLLPYLESNSEVSSVEQCTHEGTQSNVETVRCKKELSSHSEEFRKEMSVKEEVESEESVLCFSSQAWESNEVPKSQGFSIVTHSDDNTNMEEKYQVNVEIHCSGSDMEERSAAVSGETHFGGGLHVETCSGDNTLKQEKSWRNVDIYCSDDDNVEERSSEVSAEINAGNNMDMKGRTVVISVENDSCDNQLEEETAVHGECHSVDNTGMEDNLTAVDSNMNIAHDRSNSCSYEESLAYRTYHSCATGNTDGGDMGQGDGQNVMSDQSQTDIQASDFIVQSVSQSILCDDSVIEFCREPTNNVTPAGECIHLVLSDGERKAKVNSVPQYRSFSPQPATDRVSAEELNIAVRKCETRGNCMTDTEPVALSAICEKPVCEHATNKSVIASETQKSISGELWDNPNNSSDYNSEEISNGQLSQCSIRRLHSEDEQLRKSRNQACFSFPAVAQSTELSKAGVCQSTSHGGDIDETLLSELDAELDDQIWMKMGMKCIDGRPNGVVASLASNPPYKLLAQRLEKLQVENAELKKNIIRLESENDQLTADHTPEVFESQIETLDKTISQQQKELKDWVERLRCQEEYSAKMIMQVKQDLGARIDKLTKQYEAANKDKESMVMKYANSEKEVLVVRKEKENLERKLREAAKEHELVIGKAKSLNTERARVCQMLDVKYTELAAVKKDNEKVKEELNSREIKIKWAQNKLKTEMDNHKETQEKLDWTLGKLKMTLEEKEQTRLDCQEMIRAYQINEKCRVDNLDMQLKEQQACLIMQEQMKKDEHKVHQQLAQETDTLKKKNALLIEENNSLFIKVQKMECDHLEYEQNLSRLKGGINKQQQELVDYQARVAEMDNLKFQLGRLHEHLLASQSEVERLHQANTDLQADMHACREKEAELLEFTQKLTDKNVRLQSEFSSTEAKAQTLETEHMRQKRTIDELQKNVSLLRNHLEQEKQARQQENQLLARKLAEKTRQTEELQQQLGDINNDNKILKKQKNASLKELIRELHQVKRRLEYYETSRSANNSTGNLSQGSRASSDTSLHMTNGGNNHQPVNKMSATSATPQETSNNASREPDQQMLIERIVKLQQAHARKNNKIDMLEEHIRQLIQEIQRKSKIIQMYIMKKESGVLASESMDQNKAEVSKHGGIMASVYNSKPSDDSLTLELSLEINKKLQAVLEDTLLKNITLKENINTLGDEIARLNKELQQQKA